MTFSDVLSAIKITILISDFVLKLYSLEINKYPCIFEHWYMYFKLRKTSESKPSFFRVAAKREKACFHPHGSSN